MTAKIKTMEVTLNRTIATSPEEAFDAWLDRKNPATPWSDADKLILEPKVDKLFFFHVTMDDKTPVAHYGRFDVVERPAKIRYTWMSPFTRGLESIVTVTFKKKGEDTLLTVNHANLPDDDMGRMHDQGWKHYMEMFEGRFATANK